MEKIFLRPVVTADEKTVEIKDGQLVFDKTSRLLYVDWQGERLGVKSAK